MRSYVTSYNAMFSRRAPDAPAVERIEIPIIQRDYAQGREADAVRRIRRNFLGSTPRIGFASGPRCCAIWWRQGCSASRSWCRAAFAPPAPDAQIAAR